MYQAHDFYKKFLTSVKKRTVDNCAIPLSGGLDSTLIAKAIIENGDKDKCNFVTMGDNEYVRFIEDRYDIKSHKYTPIIEDEDLKKCVEIWEEPFYAASSNYYLYKEINKLGCRVSLSGLGADELFGGYDYYNTRRYPRGLFNVIVATDNASKKQNDIEYLKHHHLRKNDKIGLHWSVEGRYPFLDKEIIKFNDVGKSLIKLCLWDFPSDFLNRPKEGFRLNDVSNAKQVYFEQLSIWSKLFL